MWELDHKESWAPKIDAFEVWCWRRLFRVPWTARISYQSTLKKIDPEYSLEEQMLKLQYFGHLMQRADSLGKTLNLETIAGRRKRVWQRMRWLDSITDLMDISLSKIPGQESLACCRPRGHKESDTTEWLNRTEFQFSMTISKECWEWITYLNPEFLKEVLAAGITNLQQSLV